MAIADQHYQKVESMIEDFAEQVMTQTLALQTKRIVNSQQRMTLLHS